MNVHNLALWQSALIGWVVAVFTNIVLLQFVKPLAPNFVSLSVGPIVFWTTVAVLGASGVFALLRKFFQDPVRIFVPVSAGALLLSFGMDIPLFFYDIPFFAGKTTGGIVSLMGMHIVVALVIVPALIKLTRNTVSQKSLDLNLA